MKTALSLLAILACAALAGCAGSGVDDSLDRITDTTWRLQHVRKTAVPEQVVVTAIFADGKVTGNGGCNDYFGKCEFDGTEVAVGPVAATKKYCAGQAGATETEYFTYLEAVVRWGLMDDGRLQLFRADGEALTFQPASPAP